MLKLLYIFISRIDFFRPPSCAFFTKTSASAAAATASDSSYIDEWIKNGKAYRDVPHFISLELQRRVATPPEAEALLPNPSLPISGLLSAVFCQQIQTLQFVVPSSCFSEHPPNTSPFQDLLQRPIPNPDIIRWLRSHAGQAMLDGKCSIKDWTRGIYFPFSVLGSWSSLHEAATAKVAWRIPIMRTISIRIKRITLSLSHTTGYARTRPIWVMGLSHV